MSHAIRRRDFTLGFGVLAASALASRRAWAAAGTGAISIGYAAITWGDKGKTAVQEISALGYPGVQLRLNNLKDYPSPDALKAELTRAHLTFACLSGGSPSADPAVRAADIEKFMKGVTFARAAGALCVQTTSPKRGDAVPAATLKAFAETLNELGKRTAAIGLPLALHHHMGQIVQNPEDVAAVMAATDPRYVKLLLDTGHFAAAGGDPVGAIKTYGKRIALLHIKDVVAKPGATGKKYEFVELGQGKVDFKGVFAALRASGFHGWAVVELDSVPAGRAPRDAAAANKAYIEKTVGLPVGSA